MQTIEQIAPCSHLHRMYPLQLFSLLPFVSLHDKCDRFLHDKSDIQTVSLKLSAAKISIKGSEMHLKNIRHGMN